MWGPFARRAIFFPSPMPFYPGKENPTETLSHQAGERCLGPT